MESVYLYELTPDGLVGHQYVCSDGAEAEGFLQQRLNELAT